MSEDAPPSVIWRRSTYSGGAGECVEVARDSPESIAVRDSKDAAGSRLFFAPTEWRGFTHQVKGGMFDVADIARRLARHS
jgi:Domain of unknown function (DUF397)